MTQHLIVSRAHEVVQTLPLSERRYKCLLCGHSGSLNDLFGAVRCRPTIYRSGSGWIDESTPEERAALGGQ